MNRGTKYDSSNQICVLPVETPLQRLHEQCHQQEYHGRNSASNDAANLDAVEHNRIDVKPMGYGKLIRKRVQHAVWR